MRITVIFDGEQRVVSNANTTITTDATGVKVVTPSKAYLIPWWRVLQVEWVNDAEVSN